MTMEHNIDEREIGRKQVSYMGQGVYIYGNNHIMYVVKDGYLAYLHYPGITKEGKAGNTGYHNTFFMAPQPQRAPVHSHLYEATETEKMWLLECMKARRFINRVNILAKFYITIKDKKIPVAHRKLGHIEWLGGVEDLVDKLPDSAPVWFEGDTELYNGLSSFKQLKDRIRKYESKINQYDTEFK